MIDLVQFHQKLVAKRGLSWPERFLWGGLVPFALLYGWIGWVRNLFYDVGIFSRYKSSVKVISIGNIAAGGTGKTPVVDWLAKKMLRLGKRVVILSRGYGGSFAGKAACVSDGHTLILSASVAGDEPFLLARRNPQVPVVIARRRRDGLQFIEQHFKADLVLLDDGFQHRAVARDLDLVLLDAAHPFGNGWPLPAGLLREFPRFASKRADMFLLTRAVIAQKKQLFKGRPTYTAEYQLSQRAMALDGAVQATENLKGMKLLAFAGIAAPDRFFSELRNNGFNVAATAVFADHMAYDERKIAELNALAREHAAEALITTEKDAVKLAVAKFDFPCYQIPLEIQIADENILLRDIFTQLNGDF